MSIVDNSFYPLYEELEKAGRCGSWQYLADEERYLFSENFLVLTATSQHKPAQLSDLAPMLHAGDLEKLAETHRHVISGGDVPEQEIRMIVTGTEKRFHQFGKTVTSGNGQVHVYGIWQEMPAAINTDSPAFLSELIQANIDGIIVLDRELQVLVWNKQSAILTGVQASEALGRRITELLPAVATSPSILKAMQHAFEGFTSFIPASENVYGSANCESHYIPIRQNNVVSAILHVLHDVSHRVRAENRLQNLNETLTARNRELKRRNAELQAFSHLTSNDFKEPMRRIYTSIELLLNQDARKLSESGKTYFRQIQGSVQRLGLLADDILSLSGLSEKSNKLTDVSLEDILSAVKTRMADVITTSNAVISSEQLPIYTGHKIMLLQLFQHLLSNAIKFRQSGTQPIISITVTEVAGKDVSNRDADPKAAYLLLRFRDNGMGIEKKYIREIFKPFMRIDKTNYAGSGIGLALCRKIAELHGGFITVESEPGNGSTFNCYLEKHQARSQKTANNVPVSK